MGAIGDAFLNLCLLPITGPLSFPFWLIAKTTSPFFRRANRVVIPSEDFSAFLFIPDGDGGLCLPKVENPFDFGVDGLASWIGDGWDPAHQEHARFHLMLRGSVPNFAGAKYLPASLIDEYLPSEVSRDLQDPNARSRFENWKGEIRLVYP